MKNYHEERRISVALTRKFLKALGIESDKQDEIIDAHAETVNALKEQRDNYKVDADKLVAVQKELNDLKESIVKDGENPFEKKYNDLKKQFDDYKNDQAAKESTAKKTEAYKKILEDAGIPHKRISSILKVSKDIISGLEFDDKGEVKNSEDLAKTAKTEWADFIPQEHKEGARTSTPPADSKGSIRTLKEIYADKELAKDTTARQKAIAEAIEANPDAF